VIRGVAVLLLLVSAAWAQNGATLEIRCEQAPQFSAWLWPAGKNAHSDGQGKVRFAELAAGDYHLEITAEGHVPADTALAIHSGEYRVMEMSLERLVTTLPDVLIQTESQSSACLSFSLKDIERSPARGRA
jgi:hypothetical protein